MFLVISDALNNPIEIMWVEMPMSRYGYILAALDAIIYDSFYGMIWQRRLSRI